MAPEFDRLQAALPKRYTLVRELDRGGMSRVYLAREALPDRDVAIKVFDAVLSAQLGRERFVREVEFTSQLVHPHIVPIHAAGDAGGELYYVMPFIEGESLRDRMEREGHLTLEDAVRVVEQVAGALEHAHGRGIVHRDIKPANILFQSGHALVADFGIARALRAAETDTTLTHSGTAVGTPDYMSPEQIGGATEIGGRTDIYALACVFYEMLGGQPPFHSRTSQATMARHLTDTMPSLRALRDSVTPAVEEVVRKGLAKTPADRYRSVTEFAEALRRAAAAPASSTAVEQPNGRVFGPPRPWWQLTGVLAAVAAVGLAYNAWSGADPAAAISESAYRDSVAVLPMDDRTGDPRFEHLGLSLADAVTGHLQQVAAVKVIAPPSAAHYWEQNLGFLAVFDSLNVAHVLEGHIEPAGPGQLSITVRDMDPGGTVHEQLTYRLDIESREAELPRIAQRIAEAFLATAGLSTTLVSSDVAYGPGTDAYTTGNSWLGDRTPDGLRNAAASFNESIAADSSYAPAYAGLSSAYALSLYYQYDIGLRAYDLAANALALAERAIELDPDYDGGYSSRGYIRAVLGMDVDGAEADFDRALELAPNAPNGPSWSARILLQRGLIDDAYRETRRAANLDPTNAGRRLAVANLAFQIEDYEAVLDETAAALARSPTLELPVAIQGRTLALLGRTAECLDLELGAYDLVRALCLHAAGRVEEGRSLAEAAAARLNSGDADVPGYLDEMLAQDLTAYYGFVGEAERAAEWLRFAFRLSPAAVDMRVLASELFEDVRGSRAFRAAEDEVWERARERVAMDVQRLVDGRPRLGPRPN